LQRVPHSGYPSAEDALGDEGCRYPGKIELLDILELLYCLQAYLDAVLKPTVMDGLLCQRFIDDSRLYVASVALPVTRAVDVAEIAGSGQSSEPTVTPPTSWWPTSPGADHTLAGSTRSIVLTRSSDRSKEAILPTPVLSAQAMR
jgi:hypothetical protein